MKGHVDPFAMTAGAFVGECFPPIFAGVTIMIRIFCEHSAQNNVQGSAVNDAART